MDNIAYLGFSVTMFELLAKTSAYRVVACFCDAKRLSDGLRQACAQKNIPLFPVGKDSEIAGHLAALPHIDYFIIFRRITSGPSWSKSIV